MVYKIVPSSGDQLRLGGSAGLDLVPRGSPASALALCGCKGAELPRLPSALVVIGGGRGELQGLLPAFRVFLRILRKFLEMVGGGLPSQHESSPENAHIFPRMV